MFWARMSLRLMRVRKVMQDLYHQQYDSGMGLPAIGFAAAEPGRLFHAAGLPRIPPWGRRTSEHLIGFPMLVSAVYFRRRCRRFHHVLSARAIVITAIAIAVRKRVSILTTASDTNIPRGLEASPQTRHSSAQHQLIE